MAAMDVTQILKRLAALSDEEDRIGWASALANDVQEHGLADDDDERATLEACRETRGVVAEVRELAIAARTALEVAPIEPLPQFVPSNSV